MLYNICSSAVNALTFVLHCIFHSIYSNYSLIINANNSWNSYVSFLAESRLKTLVYRFFSTLLMIYDLDSIIEEQSQRTHYKFWKRALQTRQSESRRWLNDDELHELQQCWFKDDCKQHQFIARKQRHEVETLTQQ